MSSSKLFKSLAQLSIYERNRFRKYLISPFFNKKQEYVDLYVSLDQAIRQGEEMPPSERLWVEVYGTQPYDDDRFRKLQSGLLQLLLEFLSVVEFLQEPLREINLLMTGVRKRALKPVMESTKRKARRLSTRNLERSADFYHSQYQLERNLYYLDGYAVQRDRKSNLEEIDKNLDRFYLAEKLRNYCNVLIRQRYRPHEYQTLFIEEIIHHIEEHGYEDVPVIATYMDAYRLLTDPERSAEHYDSLKRRLLDQLDIFGLEVGRDLYNMLFNYSIAQINKGNADFLRETWDLYLYGLEHEIIIVHEILEHWHMKNAVTIGLRLGEYDRVEELIERYADNLRPEYRENAVRFNRARMHFYKKEYPIVLRLLNQVDFEDISYNLSSKALITATFYELKEYEALSSYISSFRSYLTRQKARLPGDKRKIYRNLLKYVQRLMNTFQGDEKKIQRIERDLDKEEHIADIRWLKEKLAELS